MVCDKPCSLFYTEYFDWIARLDIPGVPHTPVLDAQQKCKFSETDIPAAYASS